MENAPNEPQRSTTRGSYVHRKTSKGRTYYYHGPTGTRLSDHYAEACREAAALPRAPLLTRKQQVYRSDKWWAGRVDHALRSARQRAKTRGMKFSLQAEPLLQQLRDQKYKCAVTGVPFSRTACKGRAYRDPFGISLDRSDSRIGYTPENVRWVCMAANIAMSDWGSDVLAKMLDAYNQQQRAT